MVSALYDFLHQRQAEIENSYGEALDWEELPDRRASRVAAYASGDVTNIGDHEMYIDWFFDSGARLRATISGLVPEWSNHLPVHGGESSPHLTD